MRVISINELSRLNRSQLFALLVQLQATLPDLELGSTDAQFVAETLQNVRVLLAKRTPAP